MAHAPAAAMRRRKSTANFMDQRQTQKSIQHAVKRVMELSSLKRTTRNLAEVIEQAMAECNSRASRDSNFAHLTSEQLQRRRLHRLFSCCDDELQDAADVLDLERRLALGEARPAEKVDDRAPHVLLAVSVCHVDW